MPVRLVHATSLTPGAIAIMQLIGEETPTVLHALTAVSEWPIGRLRLVNLADIDEGIACMLTPGIAEIMPHGGVRVVQRLTRQLLDLGVELAAPDEADPCELFPEAADRFEALMMLALSRAASPMAIDLLLDQPRRWRQWIAQQHPFTEDDRARSQRLQRLIDPPIVVLAGRPNVGKSTLSNALLGRSMSIASDVAGTTRDYTAAYIDLAGLIVQWHDTPGVRESADPIERRASDIARMLTERADLLIAMRDAESDWPALPRKADFFILNKVDAASTSPSADDDQTNHSAQSRERAGVRVLPLAAHDAIPISALHSQNLPNLVRALRDHLVPPADLKSEKPWLFHPRLLQ